MYVLVLLLLGSQWAEAKPKIVLLHADISSYADDVKAKLMATGEFDVVDLIDIRLTTPTLATLKTYDAAFVWSNYTPPFGSGNVIVDYINDGGKVVCAQFLISPAKFSDNMSSSAYKVLDATSYTTGSASLGTVVLPTHPIMKNVTSLSATTAYRAFNATLTTNSYVIANWNDGRPLIAAKDQVGAKNVRRVDLNFFPVSSSISSSWWNTSTDGARIIANSLIWVIGAVPAQLTTTPKTLDFGDMLAGTADTLCVTARSLGPGTLKFTANASIVGSQDFRIISGPVINDSLLPGQSASFCVELVPGAIGARSADLVIQTNGADSGQQIIKLKGIGKAPLATIPTAGLFRKSRVGLGDTQITCIPIESNGTGSVWIDSITVWGENADSYFIASTPSGPLPSGQTGQICIGFRPTFEGRTDARVTIYTNAFNAPSTTISLFGNGILGRLIVTPSVLRFDSVQLGDSICTPVVLFNPGTDTLRIYRNHSPFADPDFIFETTPEVIAIAPERSVEFDICFRPVRNGTRLARYLFYTDIPMTFDDPARDTSLFELDIKGTGVPVGKLAVVGAELDSSAVGVEKCVTRMIRNDGGDVLVVNDVTLSGGDAADFKVTGITFPVTLRPGDYKTFSLCMTPSVRGLRNATLTVTGMAGTRPTQAIYDLAGYGLELCGSPSTNDLFTGTMTPIGRVDTASVTITNCGDMSTVFTAALGSGSTGFALASPATSGDVPVSGTTSFRVVYTPTTIGSSTGTLNILGGKDPIAITLSATGAGVSISSTGSGGNVMVGDCQSFDVTLTNNGNVDWSPDAAVIGGADAAMFTIETQAPATITAGNTGTVRIRFCPTTLGAKTASLTFPNATPTPVAGSTLPYTLQGTSIPSSVDVRSELNGFALAQSYPNPASSTIDIPFTLPHMATITITLVDQNGKVVKTSSGKYPEGSSSLSIDVRDLPSGSYLYVLSTDEVRLARRLTVAR